MRFLQGTEECDFVKVNIVIWIGDTGDGWEPWVRCLDVLVICLVSGWPTGACLDDVCDLLDVDGSDSTRFFEGRLGGW